jgi:hypothetical protein
MDRRIATLVAALLLLAAAPPVRQGIELSILQPPVPLPTVAGARLAYELHLTSFARDDIEIVSLRMVDPRGGDTIATLSEEALKAATRIVGLPVDGTDHRRLAAGRRAIVYLDLAIDGPPPPAIDHRVAFRLRSGDLAEVRRTVDVGTRALPRLGPPLAGGPWVAVYEPAMDFGHRRYVYAVAGAARIPGRHAVDWLRPAGAAAPALGAPVLAVADAIVVAARDDFAEPDPKAPRPDVALGDATGNYVALDLGAGHFAFYEHLMPGLRVAKGDRVRRGQVIARVGSTGQASAPHLHFHLASANHPLDAEGLPYRLDGLRVIGRYASIEAFGRGDDWQRTPAAAAPFPPPNAVVTFDAVAAQGVADPQ